MISLHASRTSSRCCFVYFSSASRRRWISTTSGNEDTTEKDGDETSSSSSLKKYIQTPPSDQKSQQTITHFLKGGTPCDPIHPPYRLADYGEESLYTLVLLRHGESEWNSLNKFTGWCDVNLTPRGRTEAESAGRLLKENNIDIDHVFTSVLKRAVDTTNIVLDKSNQHWVPITKSWRLNERHYGSLQGYNKDTAYDELDIDEALVMDMRRSYDTKPPLMDDSHEYWHGSDRRYRKLSKEQLDGTRAESLKDCSERIMPFYRNVVVPSLKDGNRCLIVSHANTIRSLIKQIDSISNEDIKSMSIPTGIPLLYRLDENFKPVDPTNYDLEIRYLVEPKGYTWATAHNLGFHGVYIGDLERLQGIQRKRDASNRNWQCILLRNIAKECYCTNSDVSDDLDYYCIIDNHGDDALLETTELLSILKKKIEQPEFNNMLLLIRMKDHLESLLLRPNNNKKKSSCITMKSYENMVNQIHFDFTCKLVEPFRSCTTTTNNDNDEKEENETTHFSSS